MRNITRYFTELNESIFLDRFILAIALSYSFVFIFFGLDFTDSFYYLNIFRDSSYSSVILLTDIIGRTYMSLSDGSIIYFRILNWVFIVLSVFVSSFLILPVNDIKGNLKYLAFSILLLTNLNYNIFGPDSVTLLLLTLSTGLIYKFYFRHQILYLYLFGITSSLLILARLPNMGIIPVSIILLGILSYMVESDRKSIKKLFLEYLGRVSIFIIVTSGLLLLSIFIVYHNPGSYFSNLRASMISIDETHNLRFLINGYLKDFILLIQFTGFSFLIGYLAYYDRLNIKWLSVLFKLSIVLVFALFLTFGIGVTKFNWNLSLLYSSIVYSSLIYLVLKNITVKYSQTTIILIIFLFFSIIPVLGSNTRLLKLSPYLLSVLPVIIIIYKKSAGIIQPLLPVICILLLFVLHTRFQIVYEDSNIKSLKFKSTSEEIKYIHTTSDNLNFIDDVLREHKALIYEGHKVLFYGKVSHIFNYLTKSENLKLNSFWMKRTDERKWEEILNKDKPVIIFTPEYPKYAIQYFESRKENSDFENILYSNGYEVTNKNEFLIFSFNTKSK